MAERLKNARLMTSAKKRESKRLYDAKLPTDDELNVMAQKRFEQEGSGDQLQNPPPPGGLEARKQAFEQGYREGFKKVHPKEVNLGTLSVGHSRSDARASYPSCVTAHPLRSRRSVFLLSVFLHAHIADQMRFMSAYRRNRFNG